MIDLLLRDATVASDRQRLARTVGLGYGWFRHNRQSSFFTRTCFMCRPS